MKHSQTRNTRRAARLILTAALAGALGVGGLTACSSSGGDGGVQKITLFNIKTEVVDYYNKVIKDFEAKNPDIQVTQDFTDGADGVTRLRTLISKNKAPDIVSQFGGRDWFAIAQKGVYEDLTDSPEAQEVSQDSLDLLAAVGDTGHGLNGIPFSIAGTGIIYNKDVFAAAGVEVPTTWDELIAAAETFKAKGITPVAGAFKDSWTLEFPYDSLVGTLQDPGFFDSLKKEGADVGPDSATSFTKDQGDVIQKFVQFNSYTQPSAKNDDYNASIALMASGRAAMLVQGPWALGAIHDIDADIQLGSFPFPASNVASENGLDAAVDMTLSVVKSSPHKEAAEKFLAYLMSPDVVNAWNDSQAAYSPLKDAPVPSDPRVAGLNDAYTAGNYYFQPFEQMLPGIDVAGYLQTLVADGDTAKFLSTMDTQWAQVASRQ